VQSGERTNTDGKPISNIILLSTSDSDYSSLRPHLEYVSLPNHLVLHEGGGKLESAYFPNRGLISLVVVMKDGRTAEAGVVGNEGFTGTPAAVGLSRSPLQAVVQITGDWVSGRDRSLAKHFGIHSAPSTLNPLCRLLRSPWLSLPVILVITAGRLPGFHAADRRRKAASSSLISRKRSSRLSCCSLCKTPAAKHRLGAHDMAAKCEVCESLSAE